MKLKNEFNFIYENFKYSINNQKYVAIFVLSILFSLFCSLSGLDYNFGISFLLAYNNAFYIIGLLLLILANTKNTIDILRSKYDYIIRYNSRKEFLDMNFKCVLFNNIMLIFINLMLVSIFLNFFGGVGQSFNIKNYHIFVEIYLAFCIIKFILLSAIISMINTCLLYASNNKIVIVLNIVLYCSIYIYNTYLYDINSVLNMPLFIGSYFISLNVVYSSFLFEILCFMLYFCILCFVFFITQKVLLKKIRDI